MQFSAEFFNMRSKVAQRIQAETPKNVRIFVRLYTGILVKVRLFAGLIFEQ